MNKEEKKKERNLKILLIILVSVIFLLLLRRIWINYKLKNNIIDFWDDWVYVPTQKRKSSGSKKKYKF